MTSTPRLQCERDLPPLEPYAGEYLSGDGQGICDSGGRATRKAADGRVLGAGRPDREYRPASRKLGAFAQADGKPLDRLAGTFF